VTDFKSQLETKAKAKPAINYKSMGLGEENPFIVNKENLSLMNETRNLPLLKKKVKTYLDGSIKIDHSKVRKF
jgi:hypothetical protein